MYSCSDAFHEAVAANKPQMALFVFENGVITNEDIDMEVGVEFNDYFCTKEDLSIGEALSNELNFTLMNDKQKLNNFPFGRFNALLGVRISSVPNDEGLIMEFGGHTWRGSAIAGRRLTMDGKLAPSQPGFPVVSMGGLGNKVYCFSESGEPFAVDYSTGRQVEAIDNEFMREKASRWYGYTFALEEGFLFVIKANGNKDTYEFVPLGVFKAERPKVTDDAQLEMQCNDLMTEFDEDMDLDISYPVKAGYLLNLLCEDRGVPNGVGSFINDDAELTEEPTEFSNCTKRDVIAWIAEIAACNAKISRDGSMSFVWLRDTSQTFDESTYTECKPYYYETPAIDSLCSRNLSESEDTYASDSSGEDGENIYLIQDNPFLA